MTSTEQESILTQQVTIDLNFQFYSYKFTNREYQSNTVYKGERACLTMRIVHSFSILTIRPRHPWLLCTSFVLEPTLENHNYRVLSQ